jgi:hypothetical protein
MRMSRLAALVVLALALPASTAPAAGLEDRARAAGLEAYVYGFPPILSRLTAQAIPRQTLVNIAALTAPDNRVIVLPNVDTPYSVANLDLAAEPLVLHVPAIAGRYYVFEVLDAYTDVVGYVGSRTTGTAAGDYALVGPGFRGALPPGVRRVRSPTNDVVVVGRTLALSPDDIPAVRAIQAQYGLTPLSAVAAGEPPRPGPILDRSQGLRKPALPRGLAFFDALGDLLAAQPPPARDAALLARLRAYGIGPGLHPSAERLPAAVARGLAAAAAAGPSRIAAIVAALRREALRDGRGWALKTEGIGRYGTDYELRAATAEIGLWANTADEAFYPVAQQDDRGRALDGRHRYVVRFARGQLPPARAFWSLSMYGPDLFLYANPLQRYALGDRSPGLRRDADGGLTILVQHARPAAGRTGNWLPAPAGGFALALRLYVPEARALDGRWRPPPVRRVG